MWCKLQAADPGWQWYLTFYCIANSNSSCCGQATCCVMATELHSGGGILNKVGNARITWLWDVLDCLRWSYSLIYWGQISTCTLSYTWFGMLQRLSVHNHTHVMTRYKDYLLIIVKCFGTLSRLSVHNHTHGMTRYLSLNNHTIFWHVITIICS